MTKHTVKIPDLGGASDVEVIEICVSEGDVVDVDQSLIVVESDKASMDVPSTAAGVVTAIAVSEGDSVAEGDDILTLSVDEGAAAQAPHDTAEPQPEPEAEPAADATAAPAPAPEPAAGPAGSQQVIVPDLGGAEQVELIEVPVSVGDEVAEGDTLVVMESDKASMDMPSPAAGVITALHVKEGDTVAEGDLLADLELAAAAAASPATAPATKADPAPAPTAAEPAPAPAVPAKAEAAPQRASTDRRRKTDVYAGPAVRKLARELGVDLGRVSGTGPRGRIAKEDLQNFVKQAVNEPAAVGGAIPRVPDIDFAQFGEVDVQPMSKLHKITAANMHRSWLNVPHVTQFDEADITDLESFRSALKPEMEKRGVKITPVSFLFKAAAAALRANPAFNASLGADGESIVYKQYVHIGMAVDTPAGLMVPVIRDVDQKGIWELSEEIREMADKARDRKLKPNEMQGGCFTISSLGSIGGTGFTPIVNTPEVAILGVSRLAVKPVYVGDTLLPRKMLPLSLSYDHRAINGGDAGRFFTFLGQVLADVRRLTL